jgi:elongation factor P
MVTPNQFKKGMKIEIDNEPYVIVDYQHIKMGRGGATVRTKMKSLITGNVVEKTFKSDEKIDLPNFEEKQMQFLYKDGDIYYFMDMETYEQISIDSKILGDNVLYLTENIDVDVQIFNGEVIGISLPNFIEVEVVETEPGLKGDTVSGATKPAKILPGAIVQVPLFINIGDVIKVDTRNGTYLERIKSA